MKPNKKMKTKYTTGLLKKTSVCLAVIAFLALSGIAAAKTGSGHSGSGHVAAPHVSESGAMSQKNVQSGVSAQAVPGGPMGGWGGGIGTGAGGGSTGGGEGGGE
jgi:hypothetical protein